MAGRATTIATLALTLASATLGCGSKQSHSETAASAKAASTAKKPPEKATKPPPSPRPADAADAAAYYRQHRALLAGESGSDFSNVDFARVRRGRMYAGETGISPDQMHELGSALDHPKPEELLTITTKLLAIDPTDLRAHLISASALKDTGATDKADAHVAVAKALVASIAHSGDGHSFEGAWTVYQVKEEYEFLEVLGIAIGGQRLEQRGERTFDILRVQDPESGAQGEAYFDVTELFAEEGRTVSGG